ncbi:hypothetical protein GQ44DRAFT_735368 [Phaeosphaeriaceae sp. PMI808]|nr:hypothetical protein GQ44DRAFT_735368 [Phaeosphaeriaceae sp. PMI808]
MGVLEFLSDLRFHHSYILPPSPETGRYKPHRFSYADFGDIKSNAVVFFCGALIGTRFCYSPLDHLANAYNVRIIHVDRPGIGEMVPQLLKHLRIRYISLASHSGGDIYLLNTLLMYPYLLHPHNPYVCFFAPWVHPSHSKVTQMRVTSFLPAPVIGKFASIVKFVGENVVPLVGLSSNLMHTRFRSSPQPAPVPLTPTTTRSRAPSVNSRKEYQALVLDDPKVVEELLRYITMFLFAESMDGISADAQLFLRKPRSIPWCSPSIFWSDIDYIVPMLSKIIEGDARLDTHNRTWTIDTFHAEDDDMVGEKGRKWFDNCWLPGRSFTSSAGSKSRDSLHQFSDKCYEYRSEIVRGSEHNYIMDPAFGASELWLARVRDAIPLPIEMLPSNDTTSTCSQPNSDGKKKTFRGFLGKFRHLTRSAALHRPIQKSGLSQPVFVVTTMTEEMKINPVRTKQLTESLTSITSRIKAANKNNRNVRLIAVSKLKPANDVLALHQQPQPLHTHFGENYVQEILLKAKLLPRSIQWHMIGGLQSNKCKQLAEQIPNLWCVSSVDSAKKANELEKGRKALLEKDSSADKLRIKIQVNTSGETEKSGVEPGDALELCRHVVEKCPNLELVGLMTIGAIARSKAMTAETENEDFVRLRETRDEVAKGLGWEAGKLELSMGMSADFEGAIGMGSDEVRVGSEIFGERPAKKDAVLKEDDVGEKS